MERDETINNLTQQNAQLNTAVTTLTQRLDQLVRRFDHDIGELHEFALQQEQNAAQNANTLNRRLDEQTEQLSQMQQRTENNIGELHEFAMEVDQRIGNMEQSRAVVESTVFRLEWMADILFGYITSLSLNMPGGMLPSSRLSWGRDGSLVVNAPFTWRCRTFRGSIQQFLQERHRNPAAGYTFQTDMLSRLTELGMRERYDEVIEYAIPFLPPQEDQPRGSASGNGRS